MNRAIREFTLAERTIFYIFVGIFILSSIVLLLKVNNSYLINVPIRGGTLIEGVVGNPRYINPVLALSEADKNLTALVYSGLVRLTSEGKVEKDLADSVTVSDDGLIYTAHIKDGAVFHDGTPVTADDIIFTIQKITNPAVKSPQFGYWNGISVEKTDDRTVTFTLKKPYTPFINNLSLGILPKGIWNNVSDDEFPFSQFNSLPIGSGPYQIDSVKRNSGGIPDYYELAPFLDNGDGPYIEKIVFKFYPNDTDLLGAYRNGDVESISGVSPDEAKDLIQNGAHIISSPLPRIFGVFFNQNESKALLQKEVRVALDLAAPKQEIVDTVFNGFAASIEGPLPGDFITDTTSTSTPLNIDERLALASSTLAKAGWKPGVDGILEKKTKTDTLTLAFTISTSNTDELKAVAEELRVAWEKLGARVDVQVFEPGDLNQNVIRPRNFEALLFGEVVGRDADVYPFWHSSERLDPGLNIALYTNSKVDKLLEEARSTGDAETREKDYQSFDTEVRNDTPAVFLYTPSFLYVVPKSVQGLNLGELSVPQDRFLSIKDWFIDTQSVWKVFVKK
ncbi:peptide ABC transporter substrate-binding protein [Candidatus Parcubacteria bacterium]|nr:peptide ABC transporter substrate-binding protein [Candidatus Parcubacteria bacterium]